MKLIIAGDHYTVDLMVKIEKYLSLKRIEFENVGTMDAGKKVSLQEIIPAACKAVRQGNAHSGILVCGTGAGVEIGANRFKGIRASLCVASKQAENARIYDNANVLCLSSWLTEDPSEILEAWLSNTFDGDTGRTQMLKDFDGWG